MPSRISLNMKEIIAGITTFFAMSYILFLNPIILSGAGINANAVFVATCLCTGLGCLLVGWLANYPIAVAPGMALNVYFSLILVQKLGYSWQTALAAACLSALLFFLVAISGLARRLIKAIPDCLHLGILVGLGCLLSILSFKNVGVIHIQAGHFFWQTVTLSEPLFAAAGFIAICILDYLKVPAALILGVALTCLLGFTFHDLPFYGVTSMPSSPQNFFTAMDFNALFNLQGISIVFSLFLILFFDCAGTFIGLLRQANLPVEDKPLKWALTSVSFTSIVGSLLGTSGISAYSESAAGIKAGGKTKITSMTVGILFFLCLFLSPLAKSIPTYATAPALLYVGILMIRNVRLFDWKHPVFYVPSLLTACVIPSTFSVANGIAAGTLSFLFLCLIANKRKQVSMPLIFLAGMFVIYYFLLWIQ